MSTKQLVPVNPDVKIPQPKGGRYTRQLLIDQLQAFYKRYGLAPLSTHTGESVSGLANRNVFYRTVGGSWGDILAVAGLPSTQ